MRGLDIGVKREGEMYFGPIGDLFWMQSTCGMQLYFGPFLKQLE